jgi:hypothetical protein
MAIAVRRMSLDKTLVYLSCARTKLKTAVRNTLVRNRATQTIDETDPFSPASDNTEQITATGIMVSISIQHAKSSHGIKLGAIAANCGVSMENKSENHVHG